MRPSVWTTRLTLFLLLILVAAQFRPSLAAFALRPDPLLISPAVWLFPLQTTQVYGDFDKDRLLDRARVSSHGEVGCIQVDFGNAQTRSLYFKAPVWTPGRLVARDIDRDRDTDLIWVPHQQLEKAVIWLGNGKGQFEAVRNPKRYQEEVSRLCDGEKSSDINSTVAGPLLAEVSTESQHDVVLSDHHSYFFSTTPVRGADSQILHALNQSVFYPQKRGPPLAA